MIYLEKHWVVGEREYINRKNELRTTHICVYHPLDRELPEEERRLLFEYQVDFSKVADGVQLLHFDVHYRVEKHKVRKSNL